MASNFPDTLTATGDYAITNGKIIVPVKSLVAQNIYIYVRSSGNDTTGTGTLALPYATISKALSTIPLILNSYDCYYVDITGITGQDIVMPAFQGLYGVELDHTNLHNSNMTLRAQINIVAEPTLMDTIVDSDIFIYGGPDKSGLPVMFTNRAINGINPPAGIKNFIINKHTPTNLGASGVVVDTESISDEIVIATYRNIAIDGESTDYEIVRPGASLGSITVENTGTTVSLQGISTDTLVCSNSLVYLDVVQINDSLSSDSSGRYITVPQTSFLVPIIGTVLLGGVSGSGAVFNGGVYLASSYAGSPDQLRAAWFDQVTFELEPTAKQAKISFSAFLSCNSVGENGNSGLNFGVQNCRFENTLNAAISVAQFCLGNIREVSSYSCGMGIEVNGGAATVAQIDGTLNGAGVVVSSGGFLSVFGAESTILLTGSTELAIGSVTTDWASLFISGYIGDVLGDGSRAKLFGSPVTQASAQTPTVDIEVNPASALPNTLAINFDDSKLYYSNGSDWILVSSTGSGYTSISTGGSPLTQRTNLNFMGGVLYAEDNAGSDRTDVKMAILFPDFATSTNPVLNVNQYGLVDSLYSANRVNLIEMAASSNGPVPSIENADITIARRLIFFPPKSATSTPYTTINISTIRFWWAGGVGAQTIACKVWVDGSAVASVNVDVDAAGLYYAIFGIFTPVVLNSDDWYKPIYASLYTTTSNNYTYGVNETSSLPIVGLPANPWFDGVYCLTGDSYYAIGNAVPSLQDTINCFFIEVDYGPGA